MSNTEKKQEYNMDDVDDDNNDDIKNILLKLENKYSGNAEQKHLNEMYDIGLLISNKEIDHKKMTIKLNNLIEKKAKSDIRELYERKKKSLIEALNHGINDGSSVEYRLAYDNSNKYQYNKRAISIRGRIDGVLNTLNTNKKINK
jgi:uncharacterized protein YpuA (DUF1002 family)